MLASIVLICKLTDIVIDTYWLETFHKGGAHFEVLTVNATVAPLCLRATCQIATAT